jgi:crossover junction endodeoxyribonuclease RuvC
MRVLGLDPGLTCAGFGVVDDVRGRLTAVTYGAIRTAKDPIEVRLAALYDEVRALIDQYEPEAVSVERVLFNSNVRTAMSVGQAAGVALLAAAQGGCEVAEYTPGEVKVAVAGYGGAEKHQVQRMVARLLELSKPPTPPDAADALALAIAHLHARRLRALAKEAVKGA